MSQLLLWPNSSKIWTQRKTLQMLTVIALTFPLLNFYREAPAYFLEGTQCCVLRCWLLSMSSITNIPIRICLSCLTTEGLIMSRCTWKCGFLCGGFADRTKDSQYEAESFRAIRLYVLQRQYPTVEMTDFLGEFPQLSVVLIYDSFTAVSSCIL